MFAPQYIADLNLTEAADVYNLDIDEVAPGLLYTIKGTDVYVRLVNIEDEGCIGYYCVLFGGDILTSDVHELVEFITRNF